jgi:hypothetical protein
MSLGGVRKRLCHAHFLKKILFNQKEEWNNPTLADKWELIVSLRGEVNKLLENIRSQKYGVLVAC